MVVLAMTVGAAAPQRSASFQGGARGRPATAAVDSSVTIGTYVSSRLDGKPLPYTDLADDDRGTRFIIEFDELVLALRANGEFRASLRYKQTLAAKGTAAATREPLQKMTIYGTWSRAGSELKFAPDPRRGGEGLNILNGIFSPRTITVPFDYRNGGVARRATVLLVYDPKIL